MNIRYIKMKIIVDVPQGFIQKIRTMIETGKYVSVEEFVEVSLLNQLSLEEDNNLNLDSFSKKKEIIKTEVPYPRIQNIGNILSLNEENYGKIILSEIPFENQLYSGPIWGQYNKIFPVKVTLRALANSLLDGNQYIDLDDFSKKTSEAARSLGLKLLDSDKMQKRVKGEKLSIALPVGENPYKSKTRFTNHFIGYLDSEGKLNGAPGKIKFISIVQKEKKKIGITKFGLQFASLLNPILDQDVHNEGTLSKKEIEYLIDHLRANIPEEYEAIIYLLSMIKEGKNRPSEQTQEILNIYKKLTIPQAGIFRGGLVSRMIELDLITSYRIGMREIGYKITETGLSLIKKGGVSI